MKPGVGIVLHWESVINHYCLISTLATPADAGVQFVILIVLLDIRGSFWIPAFAGMTAWEAFILFHCH